MGTLFRYRFGFGRHLSWNVSSTHWLFWRCWRWTLFLLVGSDFASRLCRSASDNYCNLLFVRCSAKKEPEEVDAVDGSALGSQHCSGCVHVPSNARLAAMDAWNVEDGLVRDCSSRPRLALIIVQPISCFVQFPCGWQNCMKLRSELVLLFL